MAVKYILPILGLLLVITQVWGHAVLITPAPLNSNAVTLQPCGVQNFPAANQRKPAVTWRAGSRQVLQWKLIASDGGSAVTGQIDTNGGTTFNKNAWEGTISHGTTVGSTYDIGFTLPADLTSCPNGVCTLQVKSNINNWVSCAFFNITTCTDCPEPPPEPPVCKTVTNADFCTSRAGKNVLIPIDFTAAQLDQNARVAYNTYIVNPNVFQNNDTECQTQFKSFMCAMNLPTCPGSGQTISNDAACRGVCRSTMEACKVTESHKLLYDCDALPLCQNEESSASLSSASLAAAAAFSAAAILMN